MPVHRFDSVHEASRFVPRVLPSDPELRRHALEAFAELLEAAHRLGPERWGVAVYSDSIRLNVGKLWILTIYPDRIKMNSLDEAVPELAPEEEALGIELMESSFTVIEGINGIRIPIEALPAVRNKLTGWFVPLLERVCARYQVLPVSSKGTHSPVFLEWMRQDLGRPEIPDPTWVHEAAAPPATLSRGDAPLIDMLRRGLLVHGLQYTPRQIACFFTALQTKGFVILSGISGTGKTKLVQHFASLMDVGTAAPPDKARMWKMSPGKKGSQWDDFVRQGTVALGFGGRVDLRTVSPASPEGLKMASTESWQGRQMLWAFFREVQRGDLILSYAERRILDVGEVVGDYEFHDDDDIPGMPHRRRVHWLKRDSMSIENLSPALQSRLMENATLIGLAPEEAEEIRPHLFQKGTGGGKYLFLSVRPEWRDSRALLGYFNPLTSRYETTGFLRFLQQASHAFREGDPAPWFIVLDEMNLAQVEYYFADLLSILESGRDEEGWTREWIRTEVPPDAEGDLPEAQLRLPPNLYIVGTVNVDETTHTLSPKVLDRAFTMELTEADFASYMSLGEHGGSAPVSSQRRQILDRFTRSGNFARIEKSDIADCVQRHPQLRSWLQSVNQLLRQFDRHFGFRVFDEIATFVDAADDNGLFEEQGGWEAAFDEACRMKILPKLHGGRAALEPPLRALLAWCIDPDAPDLDEMDQILDSVRTAREGRQKLEQLPFRFPVTASRVSRLMWALWTEGHAAF